MQHSIARRGFLKSLGWGAAALLTPGCARIATRRGAADRPPNFVVIFTDDQGYADVGCYGAQGFQTPHLDRMAAEGMRFTDFYAAQAVCSASRAGLLTGCYPNRIGVRSALHPGSNIGLNADEETIAEVLKKRGYATGIFGKWHLGHHPEFLPLQHGFDEYLGLPYSNDMWPVEYDGRPATQGRKTEYPPLPLIDGNEKVGEIRTLQDQDTLTTRYTERAVRFIERNRDRPFFLYVPHSMPHVPLGVSEKFRGKSEQGMYGDVIMEIDWSVGEILRTLKRCGLDDHTLVVFTSDNGPWLNFGNHAGCTGPLREGKGTSWEGGQRVPCIMRWPGRIPAGGVCRQLATTLDLLPTLAAYADGPLPPHPIDGVNLAALLEGDLNARPRDHFYYYYTHQDGDQLQAVRQGKWKLHFPHSYRSYERVRPGRDGNPGPYARGQTGLALYNLEEDIGEQRNVADEYPEVVQQLEALGEKVRDELGDVKRVGKGARAPGRVP